jgi:hypothetical protein
VKSGEGRVEKEEEGGGQRSEVGKKAEKLKFQNSKMGQG